MIIVTIISMFFSKISHNRTTIIDFSAIHWYNDYYDFLETLL